jgi:hypothetical protein
MSTIFWINVDLVQEYSVTVKFVAYNCDSSGLPWKFTLVGFFNFFYCCFILQQSDLNTILTDQSCVYPKLLVGLAYEHISRYSTNVLWMYNYQKHITWLTQVSYSPLLLVDIFLCISTFLLESWQRVLSDFCFHI